MPDQTKEKTMKKLGLFVFALSLLFVSPAFAIVAPDGTASITTDDAYEFYISQNDFTAGTYIGSGSSWATVQNWNMYLQPGTNYLHIKGMDQHQVIAGVLGEFNLDSSNPYIFANGGKNLLTNTTDWTVRTNGWDNTSWGVVTASTYGSAAYTGQNGSAPWGLRSEIDPKATWIWTDNGNPSGATRYFSSKITMTPEPVSMVLFGLGTGVLGLSKFRRKKK
jgi:hypothetical protein